MIEMKTCTGCGQCKLVEQYRWRTDKKTPQRYTRCDECRNAYWRKPEEQKEAFLYGHDLAQKHVEGK